MPYLTPIQGELLVAIVTIAIGIIVETRYVGRSSILANVLTWVVLIFTIDIEYWILIILFVWLMFGLALCWKEGKGWAKQFFGSKVFGSLALVLGINHSINSGITGWVVFVLWAVVALGVFWVGRKYANRRK